MNKLIIFYICFLNFFSNNSNLNKIKYILYICISFFCIFKLLINYKKIFINLKNDIFISYLSFMIFGLLSTLTLCWSGKNNEILSAYIRIWLSIPIVAYIFFFRNLFIIKGFIKYSICINIFSIIDLINNRNNFGRINGIFSHPNFYAFYLIVIILCTLYYINSEKLNKKYGYIYCFFNVIMLISAGSKTALIILAVIIIYQYKEKIHEQSLLLKIPIIIVTLIVIIFLIFSLKNYFSELRVFNLDYGLDKNQINSFEWRILKWKLTFNEFYKNIFGVFFGYGYKSELLYGIPGYAMHNEYLRIIFNTGLIGTLLIVRFIIKYIKVISNITEKNRKKTFISLLIVLSIGCFSENIFLASETTLTYLCMIFCIDSLEFYKDIGGKNEKNN